MMEDAPQINCPIDLFPKQEERIQELTHRINESRRIQQKAELVHALQEEVEVLLRCSASDERNLDCVNCQTVSAIRSQAATLILKMEKALRSPFEA